MFEKRLELANEQVKKVVDYIKENEEMFGYMNLKLYDANYYSCDEMKKDFPLCYENETDMNEYFSNFCEDNYNAFIEEMKGCYGIDFEDMKVQLGRTSSFRLVDWNMNDIKHEIYSLIGKNSSVWCVEFNDDMELTLDAIYELNSSDEDFAIDFEEETDYIINDFYNDFMEEIKDVKIVYDYIKGFKENQVESFKEFLRYEEEQLQEDLDEFNKGVEEKLARIKAIKEKYEISDEDMEVLKKA